MLADSHGSLLSIENGIERLRAAGARSLVHLGDIFDSCKNDDLYAIYQTIVRHQVQGVKGNNDYQMENRLAQNNVPGLCPDRKNELYSYLKHMPMRLVDDGIWYAHSQPFDSIRSFYEPIDTGTADPAERIFAVTGFSVLFCGHSHASILFRWSAGRVTRERVSPDESIVFYPDERYIIVVGSAENNECGMFDKTRMRYQRLSIID